MPWYRKKALTYAEQYMPHMEDGIYCTKFQKECDTNCKDHWINNPFDCQYAKPYIETLEGRMFINSKDDYIATDTKGKRYPVKKEIFEETYELAEKEDKLKIKAVFNHRKFTYAVFASSDLEDKRMRKRFIKDLYKLLKKKKLLKLEISYDNVQFLKMEFSTNKNIIKVEAINKIFNITEQCFIGKHEFTTFLELFIENIFTIDYATKSFTALLLKTLDDLNGWVTKKDNYYLLECTKYNKLENK